MSTIKRTVHVTIEKEITVELPAEYGTDEYIAMWNKELWQIGSVDDIAKYAAEMAAIYGSGVEHDGIGLLSKSHCTHPRAPDVKFDIESEETESELIDP